MRSIVISISVYLLLIFSAKAQISKDKREFRNQAISRLQAIGTESGDKIAYDFGNAWDNKFIATQQDEIHEIALIMQQKGYSFYPYYYHYLTYLAFSVTQENLQREELTKVLEINKYVVQTLVKLEYKEFLFGLNIFFAKRYLSLNKRLSVQAPGSDYIFKLLEEETLVASEKKIFEEENLKNSDESIAYDGWGNNDDIWNTNNDSWGDNDWDDNDSENSWGAEEEVAYKEPQPVRSVYTPVTINHVMKRKNQYKHPELKGPVIEIKNSEILVSTPFDSLKIKNVNGNFLLQDRTFVGSQGTLDWQGKDLKFSGAKVFLKDFHLKKDRSDFWTPNARFQFSDFPTDIEGVFEYEDNKKGYPIFTSNKGGIPVELNDEKLYYTGGIQIKGNKLYGTSVSKEIGVLKILDGRGNTVVLKSKEFVLGDSLISMNNGSITILHAGDSIYHRAVRAKFDIPSRKLSVLRNSSIMSYQSSYFDVSLNVDMVSWNMEKDSIRLEIVNARGLLPASFESNRFFDVVRYEKLARFLDFHPISATVFYAKKYGVTEFYVEELATEYDIDERFTKGAGELLYQYSFADYDASTGFLKLYPKAFHYYDASAQKVDFDNLMIPSKVENGSNAYIQLDSGKIKITGVSRFYLTTDFKTYVEPHDKEMTLLKDKNLEFDGKVQTKNFTYQGIGHQFDYDEFLINMPQIDSMQIIVSVQDSTKTSEDLDNLPLSNQLTNTSGTLFIDKPKNKSGILKNSKYPFFSSDSEAIVYFDRPEILNGLYDKSVKFLIEPFTLDSVEKVEQQTIQFEGKFNSGGIFPSFSETLSLQVDNSLGFKHQIPEEGYNLYGTAAKTYEKISLSNKGIRGYGQIDFHTTTIYSDDFIYYPDSVIASGIQGFIEPGMYEGISYPDVVIGSYNMHWLPEKDSMNIHTVNDPFKFYNSTAELEGYANITHTGVYGSGTILTRGSKSTSNEFSFREFEYEARHANFEILTDDPNKPIMSGDDVHLNLNLINNIGTIEPTKVGEATISFPYAQMKTSIKKAVWDLKNSIVTMTKPKNVAIEDSYFFSTRKDLHSLKFNGEKAIYYIDNQELHIQGIPYIIVADSKIIPENNETTILANSELREFNNAQIIIDTLNGHHFLDRANIRIISRNKFEGNAFYKQIIGKDTFDIRFDTFELKEVEVNTNKTKNEKRLMTVSGGEVFEKQNLIISPGFLYKGPVIMYASKPALELDGAVKLIRENDQSDLWIPFKRKEGIREVLLPFDNSFFENGQRVSSGIHINIHDDKLFTTFIEPKEEKSKFAFFKASGILSFHTKSKTFQIENALKKEGKTYQGQFMTYNDETKDIIFEGKATFIDPNNQQVKVDATLLGEGNKASNTYTADVMFAMDFPLKNTVFDIMSLDLIDIIERTELPAANNISLEFVSKLANLTNDETAKRYENSTFKKYTPLYSLSKDLERQLVISGVKMKWGEGQKSWYSTSKLALSHSYKNDINAILEGFLEIKKDESGADVINLFFQATSGVWYYIGYSSNQLILYSSHKEFNEKIQSLSNVDKSAPNELIVAIGNQNEVLGFINNFRLTYFEIEEPYDLDFPDETNLEDEKFDTIEEEDDGFGFK